MRQSQAINTAVDIHITQAELILKVLILMATLIPLQLPQKVKLRAEYSLVGQVLLWKLYQDGK